jgi:NitT/TauT family transport system permease protein
MSAIARPRTWEKVTLPLMASGILLLVWHYSVVLSGTKIFPSPADVQNGALELARKGLLGNYIRDSLYRVSAGYLLAAVSGIPIGLALGWYPAAAQVFNPLIQMMRPISPIAWIPLAIIWLGVGNASAIYLIFLASFFPIVVAAMNGVRNVPSMYRQAGRNFGLSPIALLARVVFPACLPNILVGLRIALGIAWLVVVAAEMVAVDSGLGYLVIDSRNSGKRYDLVVAAMILIGLIGLGLDTVIRRLEKARSVRWGFRNDG